jgi:hypothetical protein
MKMYNHLTSFLVENNYARDEHSALKILCSASDSFYDYIVCESNSAQLAQLRRQIQDLRERPSNPQRQKQLEELERKYANLSAEANQSAREAAPEVKQKRKEELKQIKTNRKQSERDQAVRRAGEEVLANIQGRVATPTPSTPESAANRKPGSSSSGASLGPDENTPAGSLANIVAGRRKVSVTRSGRQTRNQTPDTTTVEVGGEAEDTETKGRYGNPSGRSQGGAKTPINTSYNR